MIQQRSSSSVFCRRPQWAVLAWVGKSTLWQCPSSISSADHSIAHPPRCPEGSFWRGCCGMWHAQTMQVSVSCQLPEEVPEHPQGSLSRSTPNCWSCAPSRRCREVSSGTWFRRPGSFSQSQQTGSMFQSHRGGWRWQASCLVTSCQSIREYSCKMEGEAHRLTILAICDYSQSIFDYQAKGIDRWQGRGCALTERCWRPGPLPSDIPTVRSVAAARRWCPPHHESLAAKCAEHLSCPTQCPGTLPSICRPLCWRRGTNVTCSVSSRSCCCQCVVGKDLASNTSFTWSEWKHLHYLSESNDLSQKDWNVKYIWSDFSTI